MHFWLRVGFFRIQERLDPNGDGTDPEF